ncbi:MAG: LysM peptidoglycan-binding domain-containing protein [Chloroflexota bacterium]
MNFTPKICNALFSKGTSPVASCQQSIHLILPALFLAFLLFFSNSPEPIAYAQQSADGYYYTVQPGDSWGLVAEITGVHVAELQEGNPDSIRYNQWLRVGEKLYIPAALPANAPTEPRVHVVQSGESWGTIANEYGLTVRLIKSVNGKSIRYNDVLYVGEQITIPSIVQSNSAAASSTSASAPESSASGSSAPESSAPTPQSHQVGGGDSWSIIASVYGVTISELKAANQGAIRSGDVLYLGETLVIPSTTTSSSVSVAESTEIGATESEAATPSGDGSSTTDGAATESSAPDSTAVSTTTDSTASDSTTTDSTTTDSTTTDSTTTDSTTTDSTTTDSTTTSTETTAASDAITSASVASPAPTSMPTPEPSDGEVVVEVEPESVEQSTSTNPSSAPSTGSQAPSATQPKADTEDDAEADTETDAPTETEAQVMETDETSTEDTNATVDNEEAVDTDDSSGNVGSTDTGSTGTDVVETDASQVDVTATEEDVPESDEGETDETDGTEDDTTEATSTGTTTDDPETDDPETDDSEAVSDEVTGTVDADSTDTGSTDTDSTEADVVESEGAQIDANVTEEDTPESDEAETDGADTSGADVIDIGEEGATGDAAAEGTADGSEATATDATDATDDGDSDDVGATDTGSTDADLVETDTSLTDADTDVTQSDSTEAESDSETTESNDSTTSDTETDDTSDDASAGDAPASAPTVVEVGPEIDLTICPEMLSDYADWIESSLNDPDVLPSALFSAIETCGVFKRLESEDWTGDGIDDTILIMEDRKTDFISPEGDLFILNGLGDERFELSYQARSAGKVDLLSTEDLNEDEQSDISWVDTTCGASTCFATVNVRSWSEGAWQDWTDGTLTMAYPTISLEDISEEGDYYEIQLSGGIYGSVGAGPQRERVETWGSIDGAPYTLLELAYGESPCLYFALIDGNDALLSGTEEGLSEAEEHYTKVLNDPDLTTCWTRENEEEELKSFSQFRLALIAAYRGDADGAAKEIEELSSQFPNSIYDQLGQTWLDSYNTSEDVATACVAANLFAEDSPIAWNFLAEYGYINPTFSADEVCPAIELSAADESNGADSEETSSEEDGSEEASSDDASSDDAADMSESVTSLSDTETNDLGASEEGQESSDVESADAETDGDDPEVAESDATNSDSTSSDELSDGADAEDSSIDEESAEQAAPSEETSKPEVALSELPTCPEELDEFLVSAEEGINAAAGHAESVELWMRACGLITDEYGAMLHQDLNDDDVADFVLFPTLPNENGYGPGGTQGLVLIYHATDESGTEYELTAGPDVFGKPVPLGIEDYNEDGKMDLAFTVEGCSTFCVTEVQVLSWNGDVYIVYIAPGATIAEGEISFAPVGEEEPGAGQAIVLRGGVSGTPEGGLNVPHEEIWQSIDGGPYQRISWVYDRSVDGSNCLGLRLVEADMALQTAPSLGYGEAIDHYTKAIDPTLEACSIHGLSAADELILLQGLASFRLIQSQALSGDLGSANSTMDALSLGQPDSLYTTITSEWLETYNSSGDAQAACDSVRPLIEDNPEIWQITDHYGYNHPALAAQQICFIS